MPDLYFGIQLEAPPSYRVEMLRFGTGSCGALVCLLLEFYRLLGIALRFMLAAWFRLPVLRPRWRLAGRRWSGFMCSGFGGRTSVTAGTIFERTRTPLTVWFNACWLLATGKDGMSALSVKRTLDIGSYQTAWAVLHRLRSVPGATRAGSVGRASGHPPSLDRPSANRPWRNSG
jgi:hypothetical protein